MITLEHVSKFYGKGKSKYRALNDISFTINSGDTVAIVGKSGSGKSTLMHALSGLDSADEGRIYVDNVELTRMSPKAADHFRSTQIGFIFQTFFMLGNESVLENVSLPLAIAGVHAPVRHKMALEALKRVDLADKWRNLAKNLSGGQKQRVCIARAIINNPKIVFADEPTGNLDSDTGEKVMRTLFAINKELGSTLIIVTHDQDIAEQCRTRVYLKDGEIIRIQNS